MAGHKIMAKYQIDDNLLNALIKQESGGNLKAVSPKGARGPTQIMPATGKNPGYGVKPLQNDSEGEQLRFTRDYMGALLKENKGDLNKSLAAYNAGQGNVNKYGGVPPFKETQNYVKNILNTLNPIGSAQAQGNDEDPGDWVIDAQPAAAQDDSDPGDWVIDKPETQQNMDWSDVPGQALRNAPASAGRFASGIAEAVASPIDTTQGLLNAAQGGVQNMLPDSVNQFMAKHIPGFDLKNKEAAAAVGGVFKERYGSEEGFKKAVATDPVGVLADLSVVAGGAGGAAKLAGMGNVAKAASALSNITNPMTAAGAGIKAAGKLAKGTGKLSSVIVGNLGTHTGAESLNRAAAAGMAGGNKLNAVLSNMRGKVDQADVVPKLKSALNDMRKQNYAQYQQGMAGVHSDPAVLNFTKVEDAVDNALNEGMYSGRTGASTTAINVNPAADVVKKQVTKLVEKFKKADPVEFHNPGGFDELKRGIGNIMDNYDYNTPQYRVAKQVYDAVKGEITRQAPEYSRIMADSQKGIELTKEIERSLKLGNKSSADTALRSLQSVMRNNANSNFGSRVRNVELLGGNVMEDLAGQALNTWTPRGIGGSIASGTALGGAYLHSPLLASSLLLQSPRLVGEAAVKLGQAAGAAKKITGNKLVQKLAKRSTAAGVANNINKDKEKEKK